VPPVSEGLELVDEHAVAASTNANAAEQIARKKVTRTATRERPDTATTVATARDLFRNRRAQLDRRQRNGRVAVRASPPTRAPHHYVATFPYPAEAMFA
jgi:hypothetical protein